MPMSVEMDVVSTEEVAGSIACNGALGGATELSLSISRRDSPAAAVVLIQLPHGGRA
jgi:hypothetical protein